MLSGFNARLNQRLAELPISAERRQEVDKERVRLAAIELPADLDPSLQAKLYAAIRDSFVAGFRRVAFGSALLALLSAVSAWWLIEGKHLGKQAN